MARLVIPIPVRITTGGSLYRYAPIVQRLERTADNRAIVVQVHLGAPIYSDVVQW